MDLNNLIEEIKSQTKDKVKQQNCEKLSETLQNTPNLEEDKALLLELLETVLDHLKTSKEVNEVTALRALSAIIPQLSTENTDVSTSLMIAYIFTDFEIQSDQLLDEFILISKTLFQYPQVFVNDIEILFVMKFASLENIKFSPMKKSNFEVLGSQFINFLVQKQQNMTEQYEEYLQQSITGSSYEVRVCEKQVQCLNPCIALSMIYNSDSSEFKAKSIDWKINQAELNNAAKYYQIGAVKNDIKETSIELFNSINGKTVKSNESILMGNYLYLKLLISIEIKQECELIESEIRHLDDLDNQVIIGVFILFITVYFKEQKRIKSELYELILVHLSSYFLEQGAFDTQVFMTINESQSVKLLLKTDKDSAPLCLPDEYSVQKMTDINTYVQLLQQREPEQFVAFAFFVLFQQHQEMLYENRIDGIIGQTPRITIMHINLYLMNNIQNNGLLALSFDELLRICLTLDKLEDEESLRNYLSSLESQTKRLLQIESRFAVSPAPAQEDYVYLIVNNEMQQISRLKSVYNYEFFVSAFISTMLGFVLSAAKTGIEGLDLEDFLEQITLLQGSKISQPKREFIKTFTDLFNVFEIEAKQCRQLHVLDLSRFYLALLSFASQNVDILYEKIISRILVNEVFNIYDIDTLFTLLKVFSTQEYQDYLIQLLAESNKELKDNAILLLVSNVEFQLLMQDNIDGFKSECLVHNLIMSNKKNTAYEDTILNYEAMNYISCLSSINNEESYLFFNSDIAYSVRCIFDFAREYHIIIQQQSIEGVLIEFLQLASLTPTNDIIDLLYYVFTTTFILNEFSVEVKEFLCGYLFNYIVNLNENKFDLQRKQDYDEQKMELLPVLFCKSVDDERYVIKLLQLCQEYIIEAKQTNLIIRLLFSIVSSLEESHLFLQNVLNYSDFIVIVDNFVIQTMKKVFSSMIKEENEAKRNRLLEILKLLFSQLNEFISKIKEVKVQFSFVFSSYFNSFKSCAEDEMQDYFYEAFLRFLNEENIEKVLFECDFKIDELNDSNLMKQKLVECEAFELVQNEQILLELKLLIEKLEYDVISNIGRIEQLNNIVMYCIKNKIYLEQAFDLLILELEVNDNNDKSEIDETYLLDSEEDEQDGSILESNINEDVVLLLKECVSAIEQQNEFQSELFKMLFELRQPFTLQLILEAMGSLFNSLETENQITVLEDFYQVLGYNLDINTSCPSFWSSVICFILSLTILLLKQLTSEEFKNIEKLFIELSKQLILHESLDFYAPKADCLFTLLAFYELHAEDSEEVKSQLFEFIEYYLLQLTPNCAIERQIERKLLVGRRVNCECLENDYQQIFEHETADYTNIELINAYSLDLNYYNNYILGFCFRALKALKEEANEFLLELFKEISQNYIVESELCGSCPMRLSKQGQQFFEFCLDDIFGNTMTKNLFKNGLDLLEKGKDLEQFRHHLLEKLSSII